MSERWICNECSAVFETDDILRAPNPFDTSCEVCGCPVCKAVECIQSCCSIETCSNPSSIGVRTETEYKWFCGQHGREFL